MGNSQPELADGFVVFVKRDCATCELIIPVLEQLCESKILRTIFTQDDASFPELPITSDDTSLEVSFSHRIETVPTLLKVQDGIELDRTVGWSQDTWKAFLDIEDLGPENIPSYSPDLA